MPFGKHHECALEQSFMEMLYRLKRDYEKNHEASEISTLFHKACEQMYQQMKGNSVSVERLETAGCPDQGTGRKTAGDDRPSGYGHAGCGARAESGTE